MSTLPHEADEAVPYQSAVLPPRLVRLIQNSKVVAFDFDGVIADTESMQMQAFADLVHLKVGIRIPFQTVARQMLGKPEQRIITELKEQYGMNGEIMDLVEERGNVYVNTARTSDLIPNAQILAAARLAQSVSAQCFILTNGRFSVIDALCRHWGIADLFEDIHAFDTRPLHILDKTEFLMDISRSKGVLPSQMVLFEDSVSALQAAQERGINGVFASHELNGDFMPSTGLVLDTSFKRRP